MRSFIYSEPACVSSEVSGDFLSCIDLKEPVSEVRTLFAHHGTATSLLAKAVTDRPAMALEVSVSEMSAHGEPDQDQHLISQRSERS